MKTKWMIGGLVAALLLLAYTLVPSAEAPTGQPGPEDPAMARGPLPQVGSAEDRGAADAVARIEDLDPASPGQGLVVVVTNGHDEVVPGAAVQVWWGPRAGTTRESHLRAVGTGETDARGEFRCSLDALRALSPLVRRTSMLEVAARSGGLEKIQLADLPGTGADSTVRVEVELWELSRDGHSVTGSVVDAEGLPVPGATVWQGEVDGSSPKTGTDHRGRFADTLRDGCSEIVVGHPAHGFARTALPLDQGANVLDLGEIALPGPDPIRCVTGRVVLGDRRPLAEVEVVVLPVPDGADAEEVAADPSATFERMLYVEEMPTELVLERDGQVVRLAGKVRSGADGTFRLAGLETGTDYFVAVRESTLHHHAAVAVAGGAAVELVVDVQELRIDVQDARGAPLLGARLLTEVFADREGVLKQIGSIWPEVVSDGWQRLLVPFDVMLRVRPFDDFVRATVLEHHVHTGVARARADLLLEETGPSGALRIVVVDDRGEPCPEFHFRLRALDRVASHIGFARDAIVQDLSPGRWAAKVHMGRSGPGTHDVTARGLHEAEVLVVAERTTELRVVAPAVGAVAFRPRSATGGVLEGLQCVGVDGEPMRLLSRRFHGFHELETVERGQDVMVMEAFPPGRRTFTVTADGHEPTTFTVDIEVDRWAMASPVLRATGGSGR